MDDAGPELLHSVEVLEERATAQRLEFIKLRRKRLDHPLSEMDDLEGLDVLGCGKPERREPIREQRGVLPEHLTARVDAAFDKRSAGRDQEFADLTANRTRLEAESDKLLAAHFADAIDLPTLKRHQDRIRAGLADIQQRLAEHDEHHTGGRAFLHDSLRLLTDAHHAYARSDDGNRRLANQAFYTRLELTEDEQLRSTLAEPFATISKAARGSETEHEHTASCDVICSRKNTWVGPEGLEPPTSTV